MALFDISLPRSIAKALRLPKKSPARQQQKVLKKLLQKARFTEFGQKYRFDEILLSKDPVSLFKKNVPTHDYNKLLSQDLMNRYLIYFLRQLPYYAN